MNLIRREEGQDEDGRVMGYTAIRPEKLGSELLPNSDEKGSKTRPKLGSKMRPNSEKIGSNLQRIGSNLLPVNIIKINNIQTDKSVRAHARTGQTDRRKKSSTPSVFLQIGRGSKASYGARKT